MEGVVDELTQHLLDVFSKLPPTSRYLVGISGAPGSGKTTIATRVVSGLNQKIKERTGVAAAVMLPMDGFHFYRSQLDQFLDPKEAHARRGAPHTFDAKKYVQLVKSLKDNPDGVIRAPSFDHSLKDPVEDDVEISPSDRIIVLEGNYVHLTIPPWDQATRLLDERWFIKVEENVARGRVIKRHLISGIAQTEEEAAKRFDENDWPNGIYLLQNSDVNNAQRCIQSIQDPNISDKP